MRTHPEQISLLPIGPLTGLTSPARPSISETARIGTALGVQSLSDLGSLTNKTVLLRVDANVLPTSELFHYHPRIRQVASTLEQLSRAGARTIVLSHRSLGEEGSSESFSNKEIALRIRKDYPSLSSLLTFHALLERERDRTPRAERSYFRRLHTVVKTLSPGQSIFLENTRLFPSERHERAQGRLKQLTNLVDYIVYDGFGVGHRGGQLSVDGIVRDFPYERKCLGPAAIKEWDQVLSFAKSAPPYSTALILGGDVDKFESKLNLVIEMLKSDRVAFVYLGGVFGTSWLHLHGSELGRTPVSRNARALEKLRELPHRFPQVRFEIPSEFVGVTPSKEIGKWTVSLSKEGAPAIQMPPGSVALDQPERDLSPLFQELNISHVVAVGPLGYYAKKPFDRGTIGTYSALATWAHRGEDRKLLVGGGNSLEALLDIPDFRSPSNQSVMVSSGGGALLNALAEALKARGDASLIQTASIRALRTGRH